MDLMEIGGRDGQRDLGEKLLSERVSDEGRDVKLTGMVELVPRDTAPFFFLAPSRLSVVSWYVR
jgi:hypothetical protein